MKLKNNLYFYPERGTLDCNTFVVAGPSGVIIDPGAPEHIGALLRDMRLDGIEPEDIGTIVSTHLHLDHCRGNEAFKQAARSRIMLHPLQKEFYEIALNETARFFGFTAPQIQEDGLLEPDLLSAGKLSFRLLPMPGHSPESICYYCPGEKVLVCGDVLFLRNSGRADLPGGDAEKLARSIESLSGLEIDIAVPGHMGIISGAGEVKANFDFIREHVLPWL